MDSRTGTAPQPRNIFELVGTVAKIERGGRDANNPIANLTMEIPSELGNGKPGQFRVAYFGEKAKEVLASERTGQVSQVNGYLSFSKDKLATLTGTELGDAPSGVTSRNFVHLVGNLGHDPKLEPGKEGKQDRTYAALYIGSDRHVELQSFGDVARGLKENAHGGDQLAVDGRLRNHPFEKEGKRFWETQVVVAEYEVTRAKELPRQYEGVVLEDAKATAYGQKGDLRTYFPFEIREDGQQPRPINVVSFDQSVAAIVEQLKAGSAIALTGNEKSHTFNGKEQIELRAVAAQVLDRAIERSGVDAAEHFTLPANAQVFNRDQIPTAAIATVQGIGEDGKLYGEMAPNRYIAIDPLTIEGPVPAKGDLARFELVNGQELVSNPALAQEQSRGQELEEDVALTR